MKKIGFVIPWYHKDIKGGAEQELRGIVKQPALRNSRLTGQRITSRKA